MYQPYPGGEQPPGPPALLVPPPSVTRAVRVMYAGAAVSLIGIAVDLAVVGRLRNQIATHSTRNGRALTPAQVTTLEHVEIGVLIVAALITVGLWIWMARSVAAGRGWARVVSSVLFAISTIDTLVSVAGGALSAGSGAARFFGILVWLVGLVAIILLWQRPSSAYFRGTPP